MNDSDALHVSNSVALRFGVPLNPCEIFNSGKNSIKQGEACHLPLFYSKPLIFRKALV